jgi:hypothetical protein
MGSRRIGLGCTLTDSAKQPLGKSLPSRHVCCLHMSAATTLAQATAISCLHRQQPLPPFPLSCLQDIQMSSWKYKPAHCHLSAFSSAAQWWGVPEPGLWSWSDPVPVLSWTGDLGKLVAVCLSSSWKDGSNGTYYRDSWKDYFFFMRQVLNMLAQASLKLCLDPAASVQCWDCKCAPLSLARTILFTWNTEDTACT